MTTTIERALGRVGPRVSRRDALKLAGAAGAAASLGRPAPARARQAPPAGERPTLRVGVAGTTETLHPYVEFANLRGLVAFSLFDGLIARDFLASDPPGSGNGLEPGLATAWRRLDDLTLEVTLREGVTFHDGAPLTAEDVKFSFDLVLADVDGDYAQAKNTLGPIQGVEVVTPATLRISNPAPDPLLERRLTTNAGWVVPKRAFEAAGPEAFGQQPVGTGPYKVVEFRPDDALIVEAHDGWWGGTPSAARIEFRIIPEVAARVAALRSGEVDLVTALPPDQLAALDGDDAVEVRSAPVANIRCFYYNTRHPAMVDKRVRQALNLAIDRRLIVDQLWGGQALLPRGFQYPDYGEFLNQERPEPAFAPERARQLLEAATYDGQPVRIWTPTDYYTLGEEVAQAVAQMWQAVGVQVELATGPVADYWADADQKAVISGSNNNEFGDPDAWWLRWGPGSSMEQNTWTPENPRFNELGAQARSTLDTTTRYAAYQEMLDIWEEEAPGTVLYIPFESYGIRRDIAWQPYGYFFMDFRPDNLRFE